MKIHLLTAFFVILTISACVDKRNIAVEKTTSLGVKFEAVYGDEDSGDPLEVLALGQPYEFDSQGIVFTKIKFYVSNFVLLKEEKVNNQIVEYEETELFEIDLFNAASNGEMVISNPQVPVGEYKAIKFGVGVNPELNMLKVDDFAPSHPLGIMHQDMYWPLKESYIFATLEGQIDTDTNGSLDFNFKYNLGLNDVYKEAAIFTPFVLEEGIDSELTVAINIREILYNDIIPVDLVAHPQTNGLDSDIDMMNNLMVNLKDAFDFTIQ